jgi:quercetin dioxygenase-like cupin family protein
MSDQTEWHFGNAATDGADHRGWIVGAFMDDNDVRRTKDVEVKWGIHPAGDQRANWHDDEQRTTVLILVSGRFRIDLSVDSYILTRQGDYAMWGHGIGHSWQAEADSVVITIRWSGDP